MSIQTVSLKFSHLVFQFHRCMLCMPLCFSNMVICMSSDSYAKARSKLSLVLETADLQTATIVAVTTVWAIVTQKGRGGMINHYKLYNSCSIFSYLYTESIDFTFTRISLIGKAYLLYCGLYFL